MNYEEYEKFKKETLAKAKSKALQSKVEVKPKNKSNKWTMESLEPKKEPKITKHADRFHHMAEAEAQKADPHYEMADFKAKTKGHKVYGEALKRLKEKYHE